jgi:hypothetical protein
MADNLWPMDFGELPPNTPVAILREQARGLGARTGNIVVGRVQTVGGGVGKFRHAFNLYCAPLGYAIDLFYVDHGIDLYPTEIHVLGEEGQPLRAETAEQFTSQLKDVFSREKTKRTIASLIAQSRQ